MDFTSVVFALVIAVIGIWAMTEFKRFRHKLSALVTMAVLIFFTLSIAIIFKNANIDTTSFSSIQNGMKLYFSWLGNFLLNMKTVTANAIKLDWATNITG